MVTICNRYRWSDLENYPQADTLDWGRIEILVRQVLAGVRVPVDEDDESVDGWALEDELDVALVCEFGAWIAGWRWSAYHDGGPVESWLGPRFEDEDYQFLSASVIVDRIVRAVREWLDFLHEARTTFLELAKESGGQALSVEVEMAAARVIALVVRRTQSQDCWRNTLVTVLQWYFEFRELPVDHSVFYEIIDARFSSWVQPEPGEIAAVSREMASAAWEMSSDVDALGVWWQGRTSKLHWHPLSVPVPRSLQFDGHQLFIEKWDRPRDSARADRILAALHEARNWAEGTEPLSLDLLQAWQELVLGEPTHFRTTDAFAKKGRERYAVWLARPRFETCLSEALLADRPVHHRAALAYLDVCFFHPFPDGNARLARLLLDALLWREGLALHSVEPSFIMSRAAFDTSGAWLMASAMEPFLGQM